MLLARGQMLLAVGQMLLSAVRGFYHPVLLKNGATFPKRTFNY